MVTALRKGVTTGRIVSGPVSAPAALGFAAPPAAEEASSGLARRGPVRRLLDLTGLIGVFSVHASVDEADDLQRGGQHGLAGDLAASDRVVMTGAPSPPGERVQATTIRYRCMSTMLT
jgi:hypothetical protein